MEDFPRNRILPEYRFQNKVCQSCLTPKETDYKEAVFYNKKRVFFCSEKCHRFYISEIREPIEKLILSNMV